MSQLVTGSIILSGTTINGIASQEEAEAVTAGDKLMTAERTGQAIEELAPTVLTQEQVEDITSTVTGLISGELLEQARVSKIFISTEQTLAAKVEVSHGLGAVPSSFSVVLRCITAEHGFSIGDEVDVTSVQTFNGVYTSSSFANSTTIGFLNQNGTSFRFASRETTPVIVTPTPASWRFVFRASL